MMSLSDWSLSLLSESSSETVSDDEQINACWYHAQEKKIIVSLNVFATGILTNKFNFFTSNTIYSRARMLRNTKNAAAAATKPITTGETFKEDDCHNTTLSPSTIPFISVGGASSPVFRYSDISSSSRSVTDS